MIPRDICQRVLAKAVSTGADYAEIFAENTVNHAVNMIADKVEIDTLSFREGATAVRWESEDGMAFTMSEGTRTARGTTITLHICEAEEEFLDLWRVREVLERQIAYNTAIAEEGLRGEYGSQIGKVLLAAYGDNVANKAKAYAAAGSDARMNGCELPVVINSGSGNQGMTASLPVIVYAREMGVSHEELLRALVVSNLVTVRLKTGIGALSAYCGATSAGCGAAAGVTYLHGGKYREIAHTVVNGLAINSGVICDGAKASCAAKIASAVDAAIMAHHLSMRGLKFQPGEGIIQEDPQKTIQSLGYIGRVGMKSTDVEILNLMLGNVDLEKQ